MIKSASIVVFALLSLAIFVGVEMRQAAISGPSLSCRSYSRPMARLELVFGRSRPNGMAITDEEWASFLDHEVTPRFPAGLTILQGPGQWRGQDGNVAKEHAHILVIWHEPDSRSDAAAEAIRSAYKERYDQESVMRVDSASCVSF